MFHIPIQVQGLERRRRSIGLLHIVAGFFLMANAGSAYRSMALQSFGVLIPLFAVAVGSIVYGFGRAKLDPAYKYNFFLRLLQSLTFLGLALMLLQSDAGGKSIGLFLWVGIAALLAFTEKIALQEPVVLLQQEGIAYPNGFSHRKILWNAIADITLRPDFLTIHYPDNRYLQFELKQSLSGEGLQKVQDFCRLHLSKKAAAE